MRRSAQLAEMEANVENKAQMEPKAKKKRSNDIIPNTAAIDNGTMVEAFKYLNYCQLANNSLVSKRYRDVIRVHRHKLALLYVDQIAMHSSPIELADFKVFDKNLSSEAYDEWIIRNNYSKQASIEDQVTSTQSSQYLPNYQICVYAHYKGLSHRSWTDTTPVFEAYVEFNHESWPVLQHFVRLATDPFIYIGYMCLTYQNCVLNLLARAFSPNRRLQCKRLDFNLNGNTQNSITWTKKYVRCNQFYIFGVADSNENELLVDFAVTGAHCTPSIEVGGYDYSKAMVEFVQKFMVLKPSDESHLVEYIAGYIKGQVVEVLKRDYAEFIVKEEKHEDYRRFEQIIEFVNNAIGKKLQLVVKTYKSRIPDFLIKINNL